MSEEEKEIYEGMHIEDDDLTSGYSTISSNKGEYNFNQNRNKSSQLQIPSNAFPSGSFAQMSKIVA